MPFEHSHMQELLSRWNNSCHRRKCTLPRVPSRRTHCNDGTLAMLPSCFFLERVDEGIEAPLIHQIFSTIAVQRVELAWSQHCDVHNFAAPKMFPQRFQRLFAGLGFEGHAIDARLVKNTEKPPEQELSIVDLPMADHEGHRDDLITARSPS